MNTVIIHISLLLGVDILHFQNLEEICEKKL